MTAAGGFITDASLAGLARWLRLLGFDTVVYPEAAGRPMLRLAAREGRIVLTRRRDLLDRQYSGRVELVPAQDVGSQLHHVVAELALEISPQRMLGICLSCNRKLVAVGREEVRDRVPPYVFETCGDFNRCDGCGKIFWKGTHVRRALQFLENHHIEIK
jgi:uncharacterized protein with PIN domain